MEKPKIEESHNELCDVTQYNEYFQGKMFAFKYTKNISFWEWIERITEPGEEDVAYSVKKVIEPLYSEGVNVEEIVRL